MVTAVEQERDERVLAALYAMPRMFSGAPFQGVAVVEAVAANA